MSKTKIIQLFLFISLTLGIVLGVSAHELYAADLTWDIMPDRERVTVTLNNEEGFTGQVSRVDPKGLILNLGLAPAGMMQEVHPPENAKIIRMAAPRGRAIAFFTTTSSFGYIVTRPSRTTVVIDFFADPMGARWRPSGNGTVGNADAAEPAAETAPSSPVPPAAPGVALSPGPAASPAPNTEQPAAGELSPPVPQTVPAAPQGAASGGASVPAYMGDSPAPPPSEIPPPAPEPVLPIPSSGSQQRGEGVRAPVSMTPVASAAAQPAAETRSAPVSPVSQGPTVQPGGAAAVPAPTPQAPQVIQPGAAAIGSTPANAASAPQSATSQPGSGAAPADAPLPQAQHSFRGRFNPGGPDNWYTMQANTPTPHPAAATAPPVRPAAPPKHAEPAPAPGGHGGPASQPGVASGNGTSPQIIYKDSQGNIVEPPPDPVLAIAEVKSDMRSGQYPSALEKVTKLLSHPEMTPEQREEVLHLNSELLFLVYKNDLLKNYDKIIAATEEAMNYNLKSPRNASALLRLGYVNLQINNTGEAEAYFNMLRRQFPLDEHIPLTYYYWGEYHYNRGEMLRAADQFQYVVQHFAESEYAREATLGLTRSYAALGYNEQAFKVIEYFEQRWSRFYLEHPDILELMGDVAYRLGNFNYALSRYWTYYNLTPNAPGADVILTRIGDVYARRKQMAAAKEVYNESVRRFPDTDGGLIAMMRLAEEGINDEPSISNMFSVFDRPFSLGPSETYRKIIEKHPNSPLVPLAQLKLAMWYLWNKKYEDTLRLTSDILLNSPQSDLAPKAQEVALKAFAIMSAESIAENKSSLVRELWEKYPIVRNQEEALDPESRVALAVSLWRQGDADKAISVIDPFFLGSKIPEYSEMALNLALNIYLENEQWPRIKSLAQQIALWSLSDDSARQLNYALALAHENLDEAAEAVSYWKKLHQNGGLDETQMAYTEYFLTRDAENRRDLEAVYTLGSSALNRFLLLARNHPEQEDRVKIGNLMSMLLDTTERAGRMDEALSFADRYLQYLKPDDPQRQGILFRMSQIYKKQGNTADRRKILTELMEKYPDSFYGRTAASELRGEKLTDDAAKFSNTGQL